jgi:hypothetical protein
MLQNIYYRNISSLIIPITKETASAFFISNQMMKPSPNITRRHRRKISLIIRNRKIRRCLLLLSTVTFILPLSLYFTLAYVINLDPRILPPALREAKNVLFVTARPGDESLWLAPTVRGVLKPGEKNPGGRIGGLLVLADGYGDGNGGGKAERRRKGEEMRRSCLVLGIAEERCVVLRGEELNNDSVLQWSQNAVEEALEMYVKKWNIDVVSFPSFYILHLRTDFFSDSHPRSRCNISVY